VALISSGNRNTSVPLTAVQLLLHGKGNGILNLWVAATQDIRFFASSTGHWPKHEHPGPWPLAAGRWGGGGAAGGGGGGGGAGGGGGVAGRGGGGGGGGDAVHG
jgi:hypothetical protein